MAERHYPLRPSFNETRSGVTLNIDGNDFTPEELVAMVLSHAKDITAAYGAPNARDCVLTVPSFYTQHERRALLDAAELADLNVLGLIDENAAAALHYGIDRVDEEPLHILFYNMGGSSLEVSIVKYYSYEAKDRITKKAKKVGAFEILGKGWDATLGGGSFDARLVNHLAEEFNANPIMEGADVRTMPRAMAKLRIQANKVKHVLSANNEIPVFVDGLYKDTGLSTHVSRAKFEELTHDLLDRSVAPIQQALDAANLTLSDINQVELIGGGMRIPKVQEMLRAFLGEELDLGMHINSDEAMALGAAFHGANVSTAFRVREVGMQDINPFEIGIELHELKEESGGSWFGGSKKDNASEEDWTKSASVFKSFGKLGVKKTIAFTHDKDIHCSVNYLDCDMLPPGTDKSIQRHKITGVAAMAKEFIHLDSKPKVSLQFEMTSSGLTELVKAEAVIEELVTVQEEVEVDDDEGEDAIDETTASDEDKSSDEAEANSDEENAPTKNETKSKKKKKVMVEKEKKKVHRRSLDIETYYTGKIRPYSEEIMEGSKTKLLELARRDQERIMLEEAKNKYESTFYMIRSKMSDDDGNIELVSTEEQRAEVLKLAEEAEDWMYYEGGDSADLETYQKKYEELIEPAQAIFDRAKEHTARPEAIKSLNEKLSQIEELMAKWESSKPQVTEEERTTVLDKVETVRKWIAEQEEAQAARKGWEEPAFTSADVPKQTKSLETLIGKLSKKPKPKPEKKEAEDKNETKSDESTTDSSTDETSPKAEDQANESTEAEDEL